MNSEQKTLELKPVEHYNVTVSYSEADYGKYVRIFDLYSQTLKEFSNIGIFDQIDTSSAFRSIYSELGCISKDFITISNDLRRVMYRSAESR